MWKKSAIRTKRRIMSTLQNRRFTLINHPTDLALRTDFEFQTVPGRRTKTVLAQLARKARVVLCGAISQYNNPADIRGPKNYLSLLINSARMEGFIVFNYAQSYGEGIKALAGWLAEGKIKREKMLWQGWRISRKRSSSYFAARISESWSLRLPRSDTKRPRIRKQRVEL
jgi:hypothetical protein